MISYFILIELIFLQFVFLLGRYLPPYLPPQVADGILIDFMTSIGESENFHGYFARNLFGSFWLPMARV